MPCSNKLMCLSLLVIVSCRIQSSQTGGQRYNDTSHFSIPWAQISVKPSLIFYKDRDRVTKLGSFIKIGLLFKLTVIFWKDEVSPKNGNIFGYFSFNQFFYIFTVISSFKTRFAIGILKFQKWFDVDVFNFQIDVLKLVFWYFFGSATFMATKIVAFEIPIIEFFPKEL